MPKTKSASKEKKYTSSEILDLIKSIDIQEMLVPDEANRKWFRFGAYDALRILSESIIEENKRDGQE